MDTQTALTLIKEAPSTPGVYIWRDAKGKVLYVGKAVNLKSRLSSYTKAKDPRIAAMVAQARTIQWETVPTDTEALILESSRIKLLKPKFNIVMRDDKQYTYVGLTDEDFPQPIVTHQVRSTRIKKPFRRLIGPFTDAGALSGTVPGFADFSPTAPANRSIMCDASTRTSANVRATVA